MVTVVVTRAGEEAVETEEVETEGGVEGMVTSLTAAEEAEAFAEIAEAVVEEATAVRWRSTREFSIYIVYRSPN